LTGNHCEYQRDPLAQVRQYKYIPGKKSAVWVQLTRVTDRQTEKRAQ